MPVLERTGLTFDDLTVLPGPNRGHADEVSITGRVSRRVPVEVPLLSAAMPSVTETDMAIAVGQFGGLGVLHRFTTVEAQRAMVAKVRAHVPDPVSFPAATVDRHGALRCGASVEPGDVERARALVDAGVDVLALDTANPTNSSVLTGTAAVRAAVDCDLIIGSVVDGSTAMRYIDAGVDGIKVGLGSGAMCSMRRTTAIGVPQVTALLAVVDVAAVHDVPVISDGGIRCSGDIVKALAVGASSIMLGSLLAGADESPSPTFVEGGRRLKRLRGLRFDALEIEAPTGYPAVDRYLREAEPPRVEGGDSDVPASGPCHLTLLTLVRGLRGGVHMAGARNLGELSTRARLIRVSPAAGLEAHVRNVT